MASETLGDDKEIAVSSDAWISMLMHALSFLGVF